MAPTYDFKCEACNNSFEKWLSIKDEKIPECPYCGSTKVKKLISAGSGIVFKGSGFYTTDYKMKESKNAESPKNNAKTDSSSNKVDVNKVDTDSSTKKDN